MGFEQVAATRLLLSGSAAESSPLRFETLPFTGSRPAHTYSSTAHTGADVPIYATGYGAEHVTGLLDNTELFPLLTTGVISQ